jgi:hypothetical protein
VGTSIVAKVVDNAAPWLLPARIHSLHTIEVGMGGVRGIEALPVVPQESCDEWGQILTGVDIRALHIVVPLTVLVLILYPEAVRAYAEGRWILLAAFVRIKAPVGQNCG